MKTKILPVIALAGLLAAVGGGYYFYQKSVEKKVADQLEKQTEAVEEKMAELEEKLEEESFDTPTPQATSTAQVASDEEKIQKAMAEHRSKSVSATSIAVSQTSGSYATGTVSFDGEMSGGWFLAVKTDDNDWKIVSDGNGTVACGDIADFDFPQDMVPQCWDESLMELRYR